MNYAEIMAYWYLRLNGFIPLNNLVVHRRVDGAIKHNADIDLIAIRFPFVYEEVGGEQEDWDIEGLFNRINDNAIELTNLCIVEVKSGQCSLSDIKKSFSKERLLYAVDRVGIFPHKQNIDISKQLVKNMSICLDDYIIYKIAITGNNMPGTWVNMTLDQIHTFILKRMRRYKEDKGPSRMFFPEPLIQFIAWAEANRI
jgi:hypothetical protein